MDFLKIISSHLKPDGKIVLAIENRLGLKYWAGCTEDHFGTLFEGLEGYPCTSGVKTFSQKEFGQILSDAGNLKASWFYPFPDYKLPMTIYSDRRLPNKGELNRVETNYDRLRLQLFQESPVYDSLLDNDLFPQFSNSFLMLISKEEFHPETDYVKFSNERDPRFALRTEICQEKGQKYVQKLPADARAAEHIRNIGNTARELTALYGREGLELNACTPVKDGVTLEYLNGVTLEEYLDSLLMEDKLDELEATFFMYIDKIRNIHSKETFRKTPEFTQIFGNAPLTGTYRCCGMSNIDLVPANILIDGEKVSVIDYEWTFRFPVPADFIIYRAIHYYLESDGKRRVLKDRDFYGKAGISSEDMETYGQMELCFQKYIEGKHIPLLAMYEDVSPGKVDVLSYYEQLRIAGAERKLQVFYDRGSDFREEDSAVYPMGRLGLCMEFPVPEGVKRLRLDPGEAAGGLILKELSLDGKKADFVTNGFPLGGGRYYFGSGDPQFILNQLSGSTQVLQIEIEVMKEMEAREEFWKVFSQVSQEKDQEIQRLNQKIHEMENTKVWKLYRSIKKQ